MTRGERQLLRAISSVLLYGPTPTHRLIGEAWKVFDAEEKPVNPRHNAVALGMEYGSCVDRLDSRNELPDKFHTWEERVTYVESVAKLLDEIPHDEWLDEWDWYLSIDALAEALAKESPDDDEDWTIERVRALLVRQ